jgi:hypothetical protein
MYASWNYQQLLLVLTFLLVLPPCTSEAFLCMVYCPARGNSPGGKFLPDMDGPPKCVTGWNSLVDCLEGFGLQGLPRLELSWKSVLDFDFKDWTSKLDINFDSYAFITNLYTACGYESTFDFGVEIVKWITKGQLSSGPFRMVGISAPNNYCNKFATLTWQVERTFGESANPVQNKYRTLATGRHAQAQPHDPTLAKHHLAQPLAKTGGKKTKRRQTYSVELKEESEDASCSCNDMVQIVLEALIPLEVPSDASSAGAALCKAVVGAVVEKLTKTICSKTPRGLVHGICELIADMAGNIVGDMVIDFCTSVVDTLLNALGLADTLQKLLDELNKGMDFIERAASDFCGTVVCVASNQPSCQEQDRAVSSIPPAVCEFVEAVSGAFCFPGQASIRLCDGSYRQIKDITLNHDLVRAADGTCSPVFFFSTYDSMSHVLYLRFTVKHLPLDSVRWSGDGQVLVDIAHVVGLHASEVYIHPQNLIPLAGNRLVAADQVEVGQPLVMFVDGVLPVVSSVDERVLPGAYHPHLWSLKDYIIDDVIVSQFTTACSPTFAKAALYGLKSLVSVGVPINSDFLRDKIKRLGYAFHGIVSWNRHQKKGHIPNDRRTVVASGPPKDKGNSSCLCGFSDLDSFCLPVC